MTKINADYFKKLVAKSNPKLVSQLKREHEDRKSKQFSKRTPELTATELESFHRLIGYCFTDISSQRKIVQDHKAFKAGDQSFKELFEGINPLRTHTDFKKKFETLYKEAKAALGTDELEGDTPPPPSVPAPQAKTTAQAAVANLEPEIELELPKESHTQPSTEDVVMAVLAALGKS